MRIQISRFNADLDPGPAEPNLKKKNHEVFSQVVKNIKDCSKLRNNGECENLLLKNYIKFRIQYADADPDPHSICGCRFGSRRVNLSTKIWKNAKLH